MLTMLPTRATDYLGEIPVLIMRNSSSEWLFREPETPKTLSAFAIALGCLPEVWSKSLLLKTTCPSDIGSRGFNMGLIWGLAFMVPEGGMQAFKEGKQTIDMPSYYNSELLTEIYFHWIIILHYHWDKYRLWQGDRREMHSGSFNLLSIRSPLRLDQFKTDGIWDDHTEAKTGCIYY